MNLREDVIKDDQGIDGGRSSVSFGNALGPVLPMKEEEEAILNYHHHHHHHHHQLSTSCATF
jgi:hypothetical protein